MDPDEIQVGTLVEEFLAAQSLKILPQAPFGDAVTQFVTKDDKHAMEHFVSESLSGQVRQMLSLEDDEEDLENAMTMFKQKLEQQFQVGSLKQSKTRRYKPQPDEWDSDLDGHWQDQPEAIDTSAPAVAAPPAMTKASTATKATARGRKAAQSVDLDDEEMEDAESVAALPKARGRVAAAKKPAPAPKAKAKAPAKKPVAKGRGKKAQVFDQSDEEEEDDVFMDDDDHDPPAAPPKRSTTRAATTRSQPSRAAAAAPVTKARQSKLNFSSQKATQQEPMEISDDAISDDPFESMQPTRSRGR